MVSDLTKGEGRWVKELQGLETSAFVLLASGMLLVSPKLDFGTLKMRQGCIGTGGELFKFNRNRH